SRKTSSRAAARPTKIKFSALTLARFGGARAALLAGLHVRRLGVALAAVGSAVVERRLAALRRGGGRQPVLAEERAAGDEDREHHQRAERSEPALRAGH